jgi:alanyl-tRNA synthetase
MKHMTTDQVRKSFLDYFIERGHRLVASSPLIPADDPTLLFTNAGMNQFKDVFLGKEKRDYSRATSCQKCIRAGGKHNDLENVGFTARHHTFFEMLGNFSFGDYFKEEAIKFAWEWVTSPKYLGLPIKNLYPTVYEQDDEAYDIWRRILNNSDYINTIGSTNYWESKIHRLGEKDNFWSMADTGPCGPCSEIIYDLGKEFACGPNCGIGICDCDRWVEIWNLVFMQYNRFENGSLKDLPKPSVDTGAGLERIAMILQGKTTTYETDIFQAIISRIAEVSGKPADSKDKSVIQAMRVIADHVRALTFTITEGAIPSNIGRGYVLRRILRRAARFGKKIGIEEPFLYKIVDTVVATMGEQYPEIGNKAAHVRTVIRNEEKTFIKTLDTGTKYFEIETAKLQKSGKTEIPGNVVFKLYATYGFPPDLTALMAREKELTVDNPGYEKELELHKKKSGPSISKEIYKELASQVSNIDIPPTIFVGYDKSECEGVILRITPNEIITDKTPFYAESGGQASDEGTLTLKKKGTLTLKENIYEKIIDVLKDGDYIIHKLDNIPSEYAKGKTVLLSVNRNRREAIQRAHTATHLMHAALKRVLGEHANQTGSLVEPDKFRFDLTHFAAVTPDELHEIERIVNEKIGEKVPVATEEKSIEDAKADGATALFGEKYGETVRVVSVGGFSKELCGGTHVKNTAEVGLFKISSEGSIQAGVRRIEAVTGHKAEEYAKEREKLLRWAVHFFELPNNTLDILNEKSLFVRTQSVDNELRKTAEQFKAPMEDLEQQLNQLKEKVRQLKPIFSKMKPRITPATKKFHQGIKILIELAKAAEKYQSKLRQKDLNEIADSLIANAETIGKTAVIAAELEDVGAKDLRKIYDFVGQKTGSFALGLGTVEKGLPRLIAALSKDLVDAGHNAGKIIREMAAAVGGSGGGRADFAQAGGKDASGIAGALEVFRTWASEHLNVKKM